MKRHHSRIAATAAVVLATTLVAPAVAQAASVKSSSSSDTVFPSLGNAGYRVNSYDLSFRYEPQDKRTPIHADALVTATASKQLRTFDLDAYGMNMTSVQVNGKPARFRVRGGKLTVSPSRPVASGARMSVDVHYLVNPREAGTVTGWADTTHGFAVAAQPAAAHTVFPCNDVPSDKAQFTFHVTVPDRSGYIGIANGLPVGKPVTRAGYTTYTYRTHHPMATELAQIAVGPYRVEVLGRTDGVPIREVVPRGEKGKFKILALTPQQMKWAVKELGPFPMETYGIMPLATDSPKPFGFSGLETQTLTVYDPSYLVEQPVPTVASHMMHELVHSWFGVSVTPATWADNWISEGHASYYAFLYRFANGWPTNDGDSDSMEAAMKAVYENGDLYRQKYGPVAAPTQESLSSNQAYLGGPLALYALREKVGDAAFRRIERTFLETYRDKSATTDDYITVASRVVPGRGVKAFLDAWLKGTKTPAMPNHPDWKVTSSTDQDSQDSQARNKEIAKILSASAVQGQPAARHPAEPTTAVGAGPHTFPPAQLDLP
ncbi:M1 family metallopeptidase [Streptomyces wuyuanensis]|uniref:M1 family metallopeptidase n=1 Tax=Streptomyces wuyuanensis TaxID=1196353 RepID=UPI003431AF07